MKEVICIFQLIFFYILNIIVNPMSWIVLIVMWLQYRKVSQLENRVLKRNKCSLWYHIIASGIWGIVGGVLASTLMAIFDVTLSVYDIKCLFVTALIFMTIRSRFICYAYGGGVLSLLNLVLEFPNIDITSILYLVAILHIVEGLLVYVDGHSLKIPILLRREHRTIGAFYINRIWPIPLILKTSATFEISVLAGIAALGYSDLSTSTNPENKTKKMSKNLLFYGLILLMLSKLSEFAISITYIASLFSIIGHESIIQFSKKRENKESPIYGSSHRGLRVLDTLSGSISEKLGLSSGDIILFLNKQKVKDQEDIKKIFSKDIKNILITYYSVKRKSVVKGLCNLSNGDKRLGALVVPKDSAYYFEIEGKQNLILKTIMKYFNRMLIHKKSI